MVSMMPLDARVAALEKDIATLRDEASRYRSDIAVRDELYERTGSALLAFMQVLGAQLTTYRDSIRRESQAGPPGAVAAFDTFVSAVIAELSVMSDQYVAVFSTVAQIIGGGG